MGADVIVEIEDPLSIDYDALAGLANRAFPNSRSGFYAGDMRWLYNSAFDLPSFVFSAYSDEKKVGHAVILGRSHIGDQGPIRSALLADLFVERENRNYRTISALYRRAQDFFAENSFDFLYTISNGKSAPLNKRFLDINEAFHVDLRVGVSLFGLHPFRRAPCDVTQSFLCGEFDLAPYLHSPVGGDPSWNSSSLRQRIRSIDRSYQLYADQHHAILTRRITYGFVGGILICGIFSRARTAPTISSIATLIGSACAKEGTPFYLYPMDTPQMRGLSGGGWLGRTVRTLAVHYRLNPKLRNQFPRLQLLDLDVI